MRKICHIPILLAVVWSLQLSAAEALAVVRFDGSDPVVIDEEIDDDVYIRVGNSVTIADGATIAGRVQVDHADPFLMSGGIIRGGVLADVNLRITGGEIRTRLTAADDAVFHVHGGLFSGVIAAHDLTTINIYGSSFNYPLGPLPGNSGQLTGVLADGSPINVEFLRSFPAGSNFFPNIILIPEMGSAALLCMAVVGLAACGGRRYRG